jgi:hypothetical protein
MKASLSSPCGPTVTRMSNDQSGVRVETFTVPAEGGGGAVAVTAVERRDAQCRADVLGGCSASPIQAPSRAWPQNLRIEQVAELIPALTERITVAARANLRAKWASRAALGAGENDAVPTQGVAIDHRTP